MAKPYNEGERRISLIVHEKLGMTVGLVEKLATNDRVSLNTPNVCLFVLRPE